jgi:prepilin-type N-terminal cleavage/methylation domain-containing protein/prepilin-type processing-associated H-X9-DG protein
MNKQPCEIDGRNAFTLIEVLVVVSVMALLLAIALPALRGAKARARLLQCGVNMREIGAGLSIYANAANDMLPPNADETWKTAWAVMGGMSIVPGLTNTWIAELQRTLGRDESPWLSPLRCPESDSCPPQTDTIEDINSRPGSGWILNSYCRGRQLSSIPAPSDGVLVMESACWSFMSTDSGCLEHPTRPECYPHPAVDELPVPNRWAWPYAGRERNILWCDGHVSVHAAAQWPDGDNMFDDARRRHMRFNLPGLHPFDP